MNLSNYSLNYLTLISSKISTLRGFYTNLLVSGLGELQINANFSWKLGNYADSVWFIYCEKVLHTQTTVLK
jgi:hypothetical protein